MFYPAIFDLNEKLYARRKLIPRSEDLYDGSPNDPVSTAQLAVFEALGTKIEVNGIGPAGETSEDKANNGASTPLSGNQQTNGLTNGVDEHVEPSPHSSVAGSPAPENRDSPQPDNQPVNQVTGKAEKVVPLEKKIALAEARDRILPVIPLDEAILMSISHGAQADDRKTRDFMGGIMIVGGGGQVPGFHNFLEERLKERRPGFAKDVMVGTPPRELDAQVVIWKGASVFGKLRLTNDSWITPLEYDRLGSRVLPYKCMWPW